MKWISFNKTAFFFSALFFLCLPCPPASAGKAPSPAVAVIDPGHGGRDHGATVGARTEKDLCLELARITREKLKTEHQIFLTRNKDIYLSPEERAGAANHARASCLVSVHFSPRKDPAKFTEVYYWASGTPQEPSKAKIPEHRGFSDLQKAHIEKSRDLTRIMADSLTIELPSMPLRTDSYPLAVLAGVDAPAVAIDLPMGLFRGRSATGNMERAARAISQAIAEFLKK